MRTLITNARLIDGTGAEAFDGELLIEDDVIAELGEASLKADQVLDARGLAVAPGFIDMHTHSDFTLPSEPLAEAKLLQGVTTEVMGNCGLGLAPANARVDEMYEHLAPLIFGGATAGCLPSVAALRWRFLEIGVSVNAAYLIPHGNLRCAAMGLAEREATPAEIGEMRDLAEQGMEEGAFGLSTGLVYPPGAFANTEELVLLVKAIAPYGGIYASHIRVVINSVKRQHHYEGSTLREISQRRGQGIYDTILDLLYEEDMAVTAIVDLMAEEDVRYVLRHEATMIGSDNFPLSGGKPHPRSCGTFARVLGHYVRDEGLLGLEAAIHRMTGKAARKLGLEDRGRLRAGAAADLVVFSPEAVRDNATYEDPTRAPSGVPHVFVAGRWTVRDGKHTGARAGRVLASAGARGELP